MDERTGLTYSAEVNQAAGMISVQVDRSIPAAIALMEVEAAKSRQTLDEIALAVIDRAIRFD